MRKTPDIKRKCSAPRPVSVPGIHFESREELRQERDHYLGLFKQAIEMQENLRRLSARLLNRHEEQGRRISVQLHDELGQALTAICVCITLFKKFTGNNAVIQGKMAEAQVLLGQSMATARRFALELRPPALDHFGVYAALRSYLGDFTERTGIRARLRSTADLSRLDGRQGLVLFRVAQESLENIVKHAKATQVDLRFSRRGRAFCLEIKDNGRPFPLTQARARSDERLGLLSMQERVRMVRGKFAVESAPRRGKTVRVTIPDE
jgi:signal transduction histidine kinase